MVAKLLIWARHAGSSMTLKHVMTSDRLPPPFISSCVSLQGEFPIKNRLLHHSKYHAQLISLIFFSSLIFLSNQTKELEGLLQLAFSTAGGRHLPLLLFQTAVLACLWIEKQKPDKQANKNYTLDSQMSYHTIFSHICQLVYVEQYLISIVF